MKTMMSRFGIASFAFGLMAMAGAAQAQGLTGTTNLKLSVVPEAALSITGSDTTLNTSAGTFGAPFTGTTGFTYKIRTGGTASGTAAITLKVTSDFNSGGPSVASPPTSTDLLTYNCTAAASGTACTSGQTASTANGTPVVGFGANARSVFAGDSGTVAWSLPNDPQYLVKDYTAVVTFSISAT